MGCTSSISREQMHNNDRKKDAKISKTYELCDLNKQNHSKSTTLIWACKNKKEKICMKMLETPELCGLDKADIYGDTALIYAIKNEMIDVCAKILKTPELCKLDKQDKYSSMAMVLTHKYKLNNEHKLLVNYFDNKYNACNETKNKKRSRTAYNIFNCYMCNKNASNHILLEGCGHIFGLCKECNDIFSKLNECSMCSAKITSKRQILI